MPRITRSRIAVPGPPGENIGPGEWLETKGHADRSASREFDIRAYDYVGATMIDRINMAITDAAPYGGRIVGITGTQEISPDPTTGQWLKAKSHVTLDLYDGILKVANNAPPYDYLISGDTPATYVENVTIRGGRIDQNPDGNLTGDIQFGIPGAKMARVARFVNFKRLTFDDVEFLYSGVNAISASNGSSYDANILNCTFTFRRGPSTTPGYDNSAIYHDCIGGGVENNTFYSTIDQVARAAIETHGPGASVTGNQSFAFETLVNLVAPIDSPLTPIPTKATTVEGNAAYQANQAIRLWPQPQNPLAGFVVASNTLHIAQMDWNRISCGGIVAMASSAWTGDILDGLVHGNLIIFQPGDTRTVDATGAAIAGTVMSGIDLSGYGALKRVTISENPIHHAPATGIMAGNADSRAVADSVVVTGNPIYDAGSNPNVDGVYRAALALRGNSSRVRMTGNPIFDTGAAALKGSRSVSTFGVTGTGNVVMDNPVTTASGLTMAHAIVEPNVQTFQKKITIDFPSIAAGASAYQFITVPGVKASDIIVAQPQGFSEEGLVWACVYSGVDQVYLRVSNTKTTAIDPTSRIWRVRVLPNHLDL